MDDTCGPLTWGDRGGATREPWATWYGILGKGFLTLSKPSGKAHKGTKAIPGVTLQAKDTGVGDRPGERGQLWQSSQGEVPAALCRNLGREGWAEGVALLP